MYLCGVRGSQPATGTDFAGVGGHTSCVALAHDGDQHPSLVLDAGTGLRRLSQMMGGDTFFGTLLVGHLHWDHIMGLPFFTPAYIPGNRVVVYGGHAHLEAALRRQQEQPSFPVDFSTFRADISFVRLEPGIVHEVAGMRVTLKLQRHAGDSYGFRFESAGKSVVYSTDSEHDLGNRRETDAFVDFFRGADVVIFDAMYSLADAISVKADWGHSSNIAGVELYLYPIFHPAAALYTPAMLATLREDVARLPKLLAHARGERTAGAGASGAETPGGGATPPVMTSPTSPSCEIYCRSNGRPP